MRVILSSNPYRDKGLKAAMEAAEILNNVGVETVFCLPFQPLRQDMMGLIKDIKIANIKEELPKSDLIVCFGGDGTILHASRDASKVDVPILGVNLGSVGFMAELEKHEISRLAEITKTPLQIENRAMLSLKHMRGSQVLGEFTALNEAVMSKGITSRVTNMEVLIDQTLYSKFSGDGVIVATATGSTGYSLSAGGPIIEPTAKQLLITPICPHRLGVRSMVIERGRVVSIRIPKGSKKGLTFSLDGGKTYRIGTGESVDITLSDKCTKLVKLTQRNFIHILNQKLGGFAK